MDHGESSAGSRNYLLACAVTAALAGFLFGFDTIVISGAEQKIQSLWRLDGLMHGLCMSAALWGTVLGALFGGWPTERFGRRQTLLWIGVLYFVSAVGSGIAPEKYIFMLARFIGGVGVGIATVASPLYISEISPPQMRGRLAGMFQFNIVFGILIAFVSNYFIGKYVSETIAWRWMLGVEAFPALLYTLLCFRIPESPRWLIVHGGQREAGAEVFRRINPGLSDAEIGALVDTVAASVGDRETAARFWTKRLAVPILLAILIAAFNQLSGINAILYFAPRLLGLAGVSDPLSASIGIGLTNLIFTFVGLWLIDRAGRRTLLYIGSLGYIASLAVCAFSFLNYPAFRVVSRAIDVETAAQQVLTMDASEVVLSDDEKATVWNDYSKAKQSLSAATAVKGYQGNEVAIPEEASPQEVKMLAAKAKDEASSILGFKKFVVLFSIMAFIAAHAVGQGAVIWVFISEIFPNRNRAAGQALGSFTHWLFAASITLLFPVAIRAFDAGVMFAFFCAMMCLQLVWVVFMVPETKGVPLEEIQKKLGIS
ncbi:MAG: sugar porter family MFS transporter [Planctomycetota bacterium]